MSNERLVIVSDAHLGSVPPKVEEAFLAFLDAVPTLGDSLLINGDLFDFWFAYRRVIPRAGIRVVSRLGELARQLPVAMTGGNHDRWGADFWERDLGIRYAAEELRLPLGAGTVLAVHGDGVAELHWQSRLIHRVTKHPVTSALFRAVHPDLGIRLVHRWSGHLADSTRQAAVLDRAAERQAQWAGNRLRTDPEVALLVMGHTHRAALEELLPGRHYVNPGAWLDGLRYAVATPGHVELKQYPA
ncbi:MAG: UDP-2,3-diacylglucosamine diphosphatase [Gemmatimonadales bacterium]|nr:UDP-2,3-diacylglucosamine diphosphatase [Gemmatimonadales bacterium]